jgi:hypothetical protein
MEICDRSYNYVTLTKLIHQLEEKTNHVFSTNRLRKVQIKYEVDYPSLELLAVWAAKTYVNELLNDPKATKDLTVFDILTSNNYTLVSRVTSAHRKILPLIIFLDTLLDYV